MISSFYIGSTLVAFALLSDYTSKGVKCSARSRERAAVADIIDAISPGSILTHSDDGAPHIPDAYISISHSRELAVVAIDRHSPIGIDAEEWRDTLERVAPRFLNDGELTEFSSHAAILKAWTIKEAVYKLIGPSAIDFRNGIAISPNQRTAIVDRTIALIHSLYIFDTCVSLAHLGYTP